MNARRDVNQCFVHGHGLEVIRMCHQYGIEQEGKLLVTGIHMNKLV